MKGIIKKIAAMAAGAFLIVVLLGEEGFVLPPDVIKLASDLLTDRESSGKETGDQAAVEKDLEAEGNARLIAGSGQAEIFMEGADSVRQEYQVLESGVKAAGAGLTAKDREKRETLGLTVDAVSKLMEKQRGKYAYEAMTEVLQPLYAEILTVLTSLEKEVILTTINQKELDFVFQCVLIDHPEIFYVKGYTYTLYTRDDSVQRISFSGTYTMGREKIAEMQGKIEDYARTCIAGIAGNADEYTKVKYIYEYLIANTDYDLQAAENQNICSVCVYGASVCQGYAKTMQYLLNMLGVEATLVIGTVDSGEGHAWNLVKINGAYYYVDATWGDAYYVFGENDYQIAEQNLPTINYDYLCVTTEQLNKTHKIDNVVPLPQCVSMEANYYVKEGAYFTELNEGKIAALFRNAYAAGNAYVTLKCDTAVTYELLKKNLITDQSVFAYLEKSTKKVVFTNSKEQLTLSFWL